MDLQPGSQADLAGIGYGVRFLQNSEIGQRVAQHCRDAGGGGDLDPGVPVPRSGDWSKGRTAGGANTDTACPVPVSHAIKGVKEFSVGFDMKVLK